MKRVLVVAVLALVASCSREIPYKALEVGQCLPASADVVGEREQQPPVVPCSSRHRFEVYATPELPPADEWPGQQTVDATAKSICYSLFEQDTGHDPRTLPDGVMELTIAPTKDGFEGSRRDRSVECLVVLPKEQSGRFIQPDTALEQAG